MDFHIPIDASPPPTPLTWTPKYQPEQRVYTDGFDIKGQPRLEAAVVHVPTRTTIYIDAGVREETRNIMRAELVAIHTALDKFDTHEFYRFPLHSTGRPAPLHKPKDSRPSKLSPPLAPID